jgi:2-polyprenyl-6-methoxyphenol hydroxylase-like FAD-dependent oxidoreductase
MSTDKTQALSARCCIVGGGPAGMVLGWLLARAGVGVVVLEKHGDFLRDFRGDTIHPSTFELMHELGVLDAFLKRPHDEVREAWATIGDEDYPVADFSHLPTRCKFLAFMPQWEFLDFAADQARRYPAFDLRMDAEAEELIEEEGRVVGVTGTGPDGRFEVRAGLVVAADGRGSRIRDRSGLKVLDIGAPIDVLWLRLPRLESDPHRVMGRVGPGQFFIMIDRGDYWQCGYVIAKGGIDDLKRRGIESFRADLSGLAPFLADRVGLLVSWEDVKLLTVAVNRLETWHRPGLLCIGDAAHAMSPVGGVGINLAIQDAVATANLLHGILREGVPSDADLASVQGRRMFPTRMTQRVQVLIQNRVLGRVIGDRSGRPITAPWPVRLLKRLPILRRIPARLIGVGFRPEHVRTPNIN